MKQLGSEGTGKIDWHSFWKLVLIQSQNSFNEKGAQFLLIPLGVWLYGQEGNLEYSLGAIIVLPFIIFSPLVGWLSDRFCKTRVIQSMAVLQVLVLMGMFLSLRCQNLHGAIAWFCVFAIQATVFSPAKKGIVKDLVGTQKIGFASGIVEMASVLALLVGQIGVFLWFTYLLIPDQNSFWHQLLGNDFFIRFDQFFKSGGINDGWYAASFPCFVFLLCAIPVALSSFTLPRYAPHQIKPFRWSLFYEHFHQLRYLWKDKVLRISEAGIGYFWFFGGTIILMTIQIAKEVTKGGDNFGHSGAILMVWMSGGTVIGGILASLLCKNGIRTGVSLMGGWGMSIACLMLAFIPSSHPLFNEILFLAGVSAACYLIPLNAILQNSADNDKRGDVIAAGNLVDCFLGLAAVGFQYAMMLFISIGGQFAAMTGLSVLMTLLIYKFRRTLHT